MALSKDVLEKRILIVFSKGDDGNFLPSAAQMEEREVIYNDGQKIHDSYSLAAQIDGPTLAGMLPDVGTHIATITALEASLAAEQAKGATLTDQLAAAKAARDDALAEVERLSGVSRDAITRRQARLTLLSAGLLDVVEAYMSREDTPRAVVIEYEDATQWHRDSALVTGVATALGLTDEQVDDLFAQARAV